MAISPQKALELGRNTRIKAAEDFIDKRLVEQFKGPHAQVLVTTTTCAQIECLSESEFRELVSRYRNAGWHTTFKDLDNHPNSLILEMRREPYKGKRKGKPKEKPDEPARGN